MSSQDHILDMMKAVQDKEITPEEAARRVRDLRIGLVGDVARLDLSRSDRCGIPEVILAEGKDPAHLMRIAESYAEQAGRAIITRLTAEMAAPLLAWGTEKNVTISYNPDGRVMVIGDRQVHPTGGVIGIITAGTSDIRVAEEARVIAGEMGCFVYTAYDVGVAGIHRLFPVIEEMKDAHAFVVAAGREGTLPAVVAGLIDRPVIGVPVSTGYGYMGNGEAALASMLQSCSVLTVVNIDAGFVAGAFAARIANMVAEE